MGFFGRLWSLSFSGLSWGVSIVWGFVGKAMFVKSFLWRMTAGASGIMDLRNMISEHNKVVATAALVGVSSALLLYYITTQKKSKYPPGPGTLPFIGNLHQIMRAGGMGKFVEINRRVYGNIFTIELAGFKKVVVSGYDNFYKLLVKHSDHTSTRCSDSMGPVFRESTRQSPGLIWASYPQWKTMRAFAMSSLREDGMGKTVMEPKIIEEIHEYIKHFIKPNERRSIDISHSIQQATCNIISQLLYAHRFDYEDETFNMMIDAADEGLKLGSLTSVTENIPLAKLFMKSTIERERHLKYNVQNPTLTSYLEEVKQNLDPDHPKCLLERFATHSQTAKGTPDSEFFSDSNALGLSIQLYVAGSETTASAIRWALLYMCLHPDIQQRVQSEIDEQIGRDRTVVFKDKLTMPLTEAVLLETFRIANIVSLGLPHALEKDLELEGKIVPAGVDLMFNFASVLHDETVFEEPHLFNPDRYLEGDITLKKQRTIAFSLGKVACAVNFSSRTGDAAAGQRKVEHLDN